MPLKIVFLLSHRKMKGWFRKRAVLANVLSFRFLGPGLSKIIVFFFFFCQGTFSGKKVLTSGLTGTHERAGTGSIEWLSGGGRDPGGCL